MSPADRMRRTERWAALYRDGKTLRQIAEPEGVTHMIVWKYLRRLGVPMRTSGRHGPPGWHAKALKLSAQGLGAQVIAERLGLDRSTVYVMLRKAREAAQ